ncbi:MAG: hypothetical protein Q6J46_11925, partial [Thermostichus sp. DG02_2_bins_29]
MSHPEAGASPNPSPAQNKDDQAAGFSLRRGILNLLSFLALLIVGLSLSSSWFQPPPQTQLDLLQTNLSLQAARTLDDPRYQDLARALLGQDVFQLALNRYQQTAENYEERLKRLKRMTQLASTPETEAGVTAPEPMEPPPVDPVLLAAMQDLQAELDGLW